MRDYAKELPEHREKFIGENDLFLEIFHGNHGSQQLGRPSLLFVHGAFTGSWMWSKYIPHFMAAGWNSYCINLRGHYKSRSVDFTQVEFEDYLEDIRVAIAEIVDDSGSPPVVIGFSMVVPAALVALVVLLRGGGEVPVAAATDSRFGEVIK